MAGKTVAFEAPDWIDQSALLSIPSAYAPLARRDTPLEPWTLPGLPEDTKVFIKRDDTTGDVMLSGNKVRKLEFLLAEAFEQGCDTCVTVGGSQSNHARATVAAARRLGLEPHVVLRDDSHCHTEPLSGNAFINSVLNATVTTYPNAGFVPATRLREACEVLEKAGRRTYSVPLGGSSASSCWGYMMCFDEIVRQAPSVLPPDQHTTIVTAVGSGSTSLGLGIGAHLWSLKDHARRSNAFSVVGYTVANNPEHYYTHHDEHLAHFFVQDKRPEARQLTWLRQATGIGYGKASQEELQFLSRVARETGVLLDPSYTNKAAFNMVKDARDGQLRDKDSKPSSSLLFVHTGGAAGVFAFAKHITDATDAPQPQQPTAAA